MFVLDAPAGIVVQVDWIERLKHIRMIIYTFMLFLTRFQGRGVWYLFLATSSWVVLYDSSISPVFGVAVTVYVFLLGAGSLAKGYRMSRKLHDVRGCILP